MLDTNMRKYIQPFIRILASRLIDLKFTANKVTILAFLIGITSSILIYSDRPILALVSLWISGFLDSLDGSIARLEKKSTKLGALLDIVFDRIVEMGIIISLAFKHQELGINFILLLSSILYSMTVFLTVGALVKNQGEKSFKYQSGLMERTEGFIFFSLMFLFPNYLIYTINSMTFLIFLTGNQRMIEACKNFREESINEIKKI